MTGRTDGGEDLFSGLEDLGRVGVDQLEAGDRGNALGDGFRRQGVEPAPTLVPETTMFTSRMMIPIGTTNASMAVTISCLGS